MKKVELSFHVQNVPCPDEIMSGVEPHFDAYFVEIPIEYFPKELIKVMEKHFDKKQYEYPMKQYISRICFVNPIKDDSNENDKR